MRGRRSEDAIIADLFAPIATHPGADRLMDDAALLSPPPGHGFVVTTDALVMGVHMLPGDPPDTVARKAVRVNLSDLAAKGATPHALLLTLALPMDWGEAWLEGFAAGLAADVTAFACPLLGGDTVATPGPLTLSVTAFGLVPDGPIPRRSGARAGDALYVSGSIGDGALGLKVLRGELDGLPMMHRQALVGRYRVPQPRVGLAPAVLAHASAAMDVSDGLVGDLAKLCRASNRTARCETDPVPLSPAVQAALALDPALVATVLTGGDDYEVLCAVPPARAASFEAAAAQASVPVARIGTVGDGQGPVTWQAPDGSAMTFASGGFSHF